MENVQKLQILRVYLSAVKQARAIISMEKDCELSDKEYENTKRQILNDPKILLLTKQYIERNNNYDRR